MYYLLLFDEKIFKLYTIDYIIKAPNTWEDSGLSFSFNYAYIIATSLIWRGSQPKGITIAFSSTTLNNKIVSQIETSSAETLNHISFIDKNNNVYFWYKASTATGIVTANHYVLPISYQQA